MASQVNERSAARLTIDFLDFDGNGSMPSTVQYTVFDSSSGTKISGPSSVSPAEQVQIVLDAIDNQILNNRKASEEHYVLVEADYGGDDWVVGEFRYTVINLSGIIGLPAP